MNVENLNIINEIDSTNLASGLSACVIEGPLGKMIAIGCAEQLYLLEFFERKNLEKNIKKLSINEGPIIWRETSFLKKVKNDVDSYFHGNEKEFSIPRKIKGTQLQEKVWQTLQKIPYGKTMSYSDLAKEIGSPSAQRAVANAVGQNQVAIVVPCHRVINKNGNLGGYAGGIRRKEWLLSLESQS